MSMIADLAAIPLALLLSLAGAGLLYLSSRHQRLLRRGPPVTASRVAACAALLCATGLWMHALGAASGLFTALTAAMLAWVALPYLAILRRPG